MKLNLLIATVALWLTISLAFPLPFHDIGDLIERKFSLGGLGGLRSKPKPAPAPVKPAPAPVKPAPAPVKPSAPAEKPSAPAQKPSAPAEKPSSAAVKPSQGKSSSKVVASTPVKSTPIVPASTPVKSNPSSAISTPAKSTPAVGNTPSATPSPSPSSSSVDPDAKLAWPASNVQGATPPSAPQATKASAPKFPSKPGIPPNDNFTEDDLADMDTAMLRREIDDAAEEEGVLLEARVLPNCPATTDEFQTRQLMSPVGEGTAAFYSGVDAAHPRNLPETTKPSVVWARKNSMNLLKDFISVPNAVKTGFVKQKNCPTFWTLASQNMAEQVAGNVPVLLPPLDKAQHPDPAAWPAAGVRPDSMWLVTEWPALKSNPNVCSVWRFDIDNNANLLFQRNTPACAGKIAQPFA